MWRPLLARVYFMWGSLHRNFGNRSNYRREHRHAIRRFTQAYNLDPTYRQARLARGIVLYRELGRWEEALDDFNALLAEDPAFGPALLNRAMIAQEQGQYQAALQDLEAFLLLPDQDAEYRQIAGRTVALLREIVDELEQRPPAA